MELLVANGTYQHYNFNYRVPEGEKVIEFKIPAGQQVKLPPGNFNEAQIESLEKQLLAIGAVPASDVNSINRPRKLVFSRNKPVSEAKIDEAREMNAEAQQEVSNEQVENAGLGSFPQDKRTAASTVSSTLEVRELNPSDREEPTKGGVDTKITVSKTVSPDAKNK